MSEWTMITKKKPDNHGYYLGAWKHQGRWVVSELWYNPDAIGTGWFSSRGYFHQKDDHVTIGVVAWMPMPTYGPMTGPHTEHAEPFSEEKT